MSNNGIHLTDYHEAVKTWLAENLPWLKSVDYYPEVAAPLTAPCAFFGVMDWERADSQPVSGQLAVVLSCEILVVFGKADLTYQLEVRNAAMAIGLKIEDCRFGLPVKPATFISAEPDGFNPELDEYAAWSIRFNQEVKVGADQAMISAELFNPGGSLKAGYTPDIGTGNEDKYEEVSNAQS